VTWLRDARIAAGLSQSTLAAAAGISRQAVGAIEAGHHRPGVDAALALAAAVGRPVEELFAARPAPASVTVNREAVPDGTGVLAAHVGARLVHAPADSALASAGWPFADAVMRDGGVQPLPGADFDGLVAVGCDPALGVAAALLPSTGARRLIAISGSTAAALSAMREGRAHCALVHGAEGRLPKPDPGTLRLQLARWRVGVASRGRRPRPIAELCGRRLRVVQREEGASSQKAFAAAVAAEGLPLPKGPLATGHLEAARRVSHGAAAAVTMEPAALRLRLAFLPLEEHVAEVWVHPRWSAHPGVEALGNVLRSAAFKQRVGLVGGYEL
jgi:DNA-binding XRE family transcriptional regulator/molybdate-binding protein